MKQVVYGSRQCAIVVVSYNLPIDEIGQNSNLLMLIARFLSLDKELAELIIGIGIGALSAAPASTPAPPRLLSSSNY